MQRRFLVVFLAGLLLQIALYAAQQASASAGAGRVNRTVESVLAMLYAPILPATEWLAQPIVAAGREETRQIRLLGFLLAAAPAVGAVTYAVLLAVVVTAGRELVALFARRILRHA